MYSGLVIHLCQLCYVCLPIDTLCLILSCHWLDFLALSRSWSMYSLLPALRISAEVDWTAYAVLFAGCHFVRRVSDFQLATVSGTQTKLDEDSRALLIFLLNFTTLPYIMWRFLWYG